MNLKEKIIQESMRLFSTKGYCSTSITDILVAANTSKGGFYNHFASKETLFIHVLEAAQGIWRERTLAGLDEIDSPVGKIERLLHNYRDRYLKDNKTFPGGCIFVTFSVELDYIHPHLAQEVNQGFIGFKAMLARLLEDGKERGELPLDIQSDDLAEMLFAGMLGASVIYGLDQSTVSLDRTIDSLIDSLEKLRISNEDKELSPLLAGEVPVT
ncbi:MAG: TetR/AcrR family transcriptional regulator [Chloroflexota bacterium]|nr:MAG: TetR/AcrR family transcriptional regulator [Chloroflexota bacterium]